MLINKIKGNYVCKCCLEKASSDLERAYNKKWVFRTSITFFILRLFLAALMWFDILENEPKKMGRQIKCIKKTKFLLVCIVVVYVLGNFFENFCINWYVGLFFTILHLIYLMIYLYFIFLCEKLPPVAAYVLFSLFSVFPIHCLATLIFINKIYKLFFIFLSFLIAILI